MAKAKQRTRSSETERYDASAFERLSVAVDVAPIHVRDGAFGTLLVRRDAHPHRRCLALPGTFVAVEESLDEAAARALRDKAGLSGVYLEQLYTFGAPARDRRTRIVSVAYYALVDAQRLEGITLSAHDVVTARIEVRRRTLASGQLEATGERQREVDHRPAELYRFARRSAV
ncbi:MAG TPA: NUDIX hydrolase [Polyangiaceae bacterium]|nr:NUDIX hydrolase [Polyangiaceae bacterium]